MEYEGPIHIHADLESACLIVDVYDQFLVKHEQFDWRLSKENCRCFDDPFHTRAHPVKTVKIDIARPDMTDVLSSIIDEHIPEEAKRPEKYKRIQTEPEWNGAGLHNAVYRYFVKSAPDEPLPKSRLIDRLRRLLRVNRRADDFFWEHAIRRHFRTTPEELAKIRATVDHLRNTNKKTVQTDTERILDQ